MLNLIKLENRIVLDGAAVGEALDHALDHESAISGNPFAPEHIGDTDHIASAAALLADDPVGEPQPEPIEIVLIADSLPDYQALANAATPGAQVVVFNADESAEEVIRRITELGLPVDSLSILSHGDSGNFRLGNEVITAESVEENADTWGALSTVMTDDAHIYIFGCNAGSGEGQRLLDSLAQSTGADVWASDDMTGAEGDWDLEIGSREADNGTPPLDTDALAEYSGSLTPPVIQGTPPTTVNQDSEYSFTPTAMDAEDDIIGFSVSNQPEWAQFDSNTGRLHGTPVNADVGEYSGIRIGVTDQSGETSWLPAFGITVLNMNDDPEISGEPAVTVQEGQQYTFVPTAQDPDTIPGIDPSETLTFSIQNKPFWATFDPDTGKLSGTPGRGDVGTYSNITITVTDRSGVTDALNHFNITVEELNTAPVISGAPATSVQQDGSYYFKPTASDAEDSDASLRFSISNQPEWTNFNPNTGELSGKPVNDDVGTYQNIKITVTDSNGLSESLPEFDVTVVNVNDLPDISGTSMNDVQEGIYYSFIPTSSDIDMRVVDTESLTFSIENKPDWANFDANTGELSGTPQKPDVGVHNNIRITVTDAGGMSDALVFDLNVVNVNEAPTISGTPPTQVDEDSPYYFRPTVSDIDDDPASLQFSISKQPEWAEFNPNTGELTGTPLNEHVGMSSGIIITVTDSTGLSASLSEFSIEVVNVNDRPTISGTSMHEVQEGSSYSFVPTSSDEDVLVDPGERLIFSIENKPAWAEFNLNTGELSGTPERSDVGDYNNIVITVTDAYGLDKSLNFNLSVSQLSTSPEIEGIPPTIVDEDTLYSFTPTAYDLDGDPLEFSISHQPPWADFDRATGKLSGTPENADVGTYKEILITVTDTTGLSASLDPFNIEVVNVNDPPTITGTSTQSVQEGNVYSFIPTSNDVDLLVVNSPEKLSYTVHNAPGWTAFNPNTGELSGIPTNADIGVYNDIVITVTDVEGVIASLRFDLTVTSSNTPPNIQGSPDDMVLQGQDYYFRPVATDNEDLVAGLEFSISNQPAWATFDKSTGELSGVPANEDVGIYHSIEITVTDSGGLSDSLVFTIEVVNVNDGPKIVSEAVTKVRLGNDYNFEPTRSDVDMRPGYNVAVVDPSEYLTYDIENMPQWASFEPATGRLHGVPTDNRDIADGGDVGIWENVTITVTDSYGESNELIFPITVIYVNTPPVVQPAIKEIDEGTPEGTPVHKVVATDAEDDIVDDFVIIGGNDDGIFDIDPKTGVITVAKAVPDWEDTPQYDLIVQAKDDDGATTEATITVIVNNVKPAINLDPDGDGGDGTGEPDQEPPYPPDFNATFTEGDDPVTLVDSDAVVSDPNNDDIVSMTVTITNVAPDDVLSVDTLDTNITADYADGVLTLSGTDTAENYTRVMRTVAFHNPSENPDGTQRIVKFMAKDTNGNDSNVATCYLTVVPVNDPPVNYAPGAQTTPQDTPLVFSDGNDNRISVSDVDANPYDVEVTLHVDHSTLEVGSTTDVVVTRNAENNEIVIRGTLDAVNNALNNLVYTPTTGWIGEATLTITTNDLGHTGVHPDTGGVDANGFSVPPLFAVSTVPIFVGNPPSHIAPTAAAEAEDREPGPDRAPGLGEGRGFGLGFLYDPGDVQEVGSYLIPPPPPGERFQPFPPCKDMVLYKCCTLEEALRIGCRFAPALDPEAWLCNVTWEWMKSEGWEDPYLDEEFSLYSSNPDQHHFLRESGDVGLNGMPGDLAWGFFGETREEGIPAYLLSDNFVQGAEGEFNAAPGDLKQSFFVDRESYDVPATWGSTAWPELQDPGNVIPCGEDNAVIRDGVARSYETSVLRTEEPVRTPTERPSGMVEENLIRRETFRSDQAGGFVEVNSLSVQNGQPEEFEVASPSGSNEAEVIEYTETVEPEDDETVEDALSPLDRVIMSIGDAAE
ncbi:putative Ig domain-containing protein [Desulfobacterales bacterium HSG2]|nr:putative Ig domain-containing protein [Desulfobacterales bacterium HSG2]